MNGKCEKKRHKKAKVNGNWGKEEAEKRRKGNVKWGKKGLKKGERNVK